MTRRATPFLLLLTTLAPLPAQTPARPEYAPLVQEVEAAGQAVADALNARDRGQVASRRADFDAAVDRLLASEQLLTTRDYNRSATVAMIVGCPATCQKIARFAIAELEQPGQLREFLGIANMTLCQEVDTDAEMRALATEAVSALEIWCEAKPGSIGPSHLIHAYSTLGEWAKALAWDDRLRERRSNITCPPFYRAILLLGAEQWQPAIELLRSEDVAEAAEAGEIDLLVARAESMRGEHEKAISVARANLEREVTDSAVEALADALARSGKYDAALKLLKKHPVTEESDDPRIAAALRKSRATLVYLIGLRGKPPTNLRQRLAELLEVRIAVMGAAPGAEKLQKSPWALGWTARKVPSGPAGWANDVLFAVCVRDIATYEQPEGERQLLGALLDDAARAALTGDDAVKIARRNVRASLVYSGAPGVLVVDQLMSRL
ncbi:MAG: hypothetical protein KDE27_14845 [Planctomycetes bacterium]|nr:hypothetical protein [Planctomycetota bacterium]